MYAHFGSKNSLLLTVVQRALERISAANYDALDALANRPHNLEQGLVEFAHQLVHNRYHNPETPGLRRLLHSHLGQDPKLVNLVRAQGPVRLADALAGRLARLANAGHLNVADPDRAAHQFLALVSYDAENTTLTAHGDIDDDTLPEILTANVRMFLRAYTVRPNRKT